MARKTQRETIETVRTRFLQARTVADAMRDRRDAHYKAYRSHRDPITDKDGKVVTGRSNIFVPRTFSGIETVATRLMNAVFAQEGPVFGVKPRNHDAVDQAESMELLIDYQAEKTHFRAVAEDVCKSALIYEYGVAKIIWSKSPMRRVSKIVRRPHDNPALEAQGVYVYESVSEEVRAYTGPRVMACDIDDVFIDPAGASPYGDDWRYVIHRLWEPLSVIDRKADEGVYNKSAANKLKRAATEEMKKPAAQRQGLVDLGADSGSLDDVDPIIQLLEYWSGDEVIVVPWQHEGVLLRQDDNPYGFLPFALWRDVTLPNELGGISEAEAMADEQDALNTMANAVIDQAKLNVIQPMAYDPDTILDEADLDVSSGKPYVPVKPPRGKPLREAFQELPVGRLGPEGPALIAMFKEDLQDVTGTYDEIRGQHVNETATQASIRSQAASVRFEDKIHRFETEFLAPIGEKWARLNQQFMDEEVVLRLEGDKGFDFRTIGPEAIAGDFDVEVRGANVDAEVSPQQHRQDFTGMLQVLVAFAQAAPILKQLGVDVPEVIRYGMGLFEPERLDDFFPQQDEAAQGAPGQPAPPGANPLANLPPEIQQALGTVIHHVAAAASQQAPQAPPQAAAQAPQPTQPAPQGTTPAAGPAALLGLLSAAQQGGVAVGQ